MTSDEPTYPGEEGESVEEVLGPDSLRAAADSNQTDSYGRWQMRAHADAWEAERKDNAALREAIDAVLRECGSEPDSRYARNACIIGAAALASLSKERR